MVELHKRNSWMMYLQQFDLPASNFQNITKETNKFCLIIEPRNHPLLITVIKNFMYLLQNKGWGLIVCHGTKNEDFVLEGLAGWPNVIYKNINVENLSYYEYSELCLRKSFWEDCLQFGAEHILVFQADTLLRKDNTDDFLKFDYVGAPWPERHMKLPSQIGNGGLSLRKTRTLIKLLEEYPCTKPFENEDVHIAKHLHLVGANVPTMYEATKFSVETIFWDPDPMGFHKPPWDHIFPSLQIFDDLFSKRYL